MLKTDRMNGARTVAFVAICFISLILLSSISPAEDWPNWRGPRHDGTWNAPDFPQDWKPDQSQIGWKKTIGGGYGGIAVVGDRLYLMDRLKPEKGDEKSSERERILCYRASDGEFIWQHEYPVEYGTLGYGNGPRSTPTVADGRVYAFGALGHTFCLDAETGDVIWSKDPQADFEVQLPEWGLAASPLLYRDLVIVHPGGKNGRCFVALERDTGRERWRAGDDPGGYATPIMADTPDGVQIIGWTPEHIVGINPETGVLLWKIPYKIQYGVSIATPYYHDGVVVVCGYWEGSKGIQLGDSPGSAKLLWEENKYLRGLMNPPLFKQGKLFILDKQFGVTCFEMQTGKKLWDDNNTLTPRGRNPQANFVWLDRDNSDRVLALNSEGDLILAEFRADGYSEIGRRNIIGNTWACPAFAGKSVYARSDTELVGVSLLPQTPLP